MRKVTLGVVVGAVLLGGLIGSTCAVGATPAPGYLIESIPTPTNFTTAADTECTTNRGAGPEPGSCNSYIVTVTNSGSLSTDGSPITVTETLPAGMTAQFMAGQVLSTGRTIECPYGSAQCTYGGVLAPGQTLGFYLYVSVAPSLAGSVTTAVQVSGGGAVPATASFQNMVSSIPATPGLSSFAFTLAGVDGALDTQAGSHPFGVTASFQFSSELGALGGTQGIAAQHEVYPAVQDVKDVVVDLPPGFVGDTQVASQCTERELEPTHEEIEREHIVSGDTKCPASSAVGTISLDDGGHVEFGGESFLPTPIIYNMVPERGYPAEFGFNFAGHAVVLYATAVPSSQGYVLQVSSPGILRFLRIGGISLTFWGVPGEAGHDGLRGGPSGLGPVGFLTNPVDCSAGPLAATAMSDTWQNPGRWTAEGSPDVSDPAWHVQSRTIYPSITGCDMLQFAPGIEVTPEVTQVDEPSGLTVDIRVPQAPQLPPDLTTPEFKNVTVTLPSGFSISPSAGDGLQACTPAEIGLESRLPGSCPNGSVLGTVAATTPLLASPLEGQVFLGQPGCDPCTNADAADGAMFNIYLELAGAGVVVKQHGTIYANTTTGQLTTVFREAPQLPVSDLQVHFKGGLRASLATPQACGQFVTTTDITPWSSPVTPDATPSSAFYASFDGNGGACPASMPFAPSFSAGTSNANAGQFSPLTLTFNREDREQDLAGIQVKTPPGLLGTLTGVPLCGEPQADLGTCPEASRIGTMTVAAGPGGHPFYAKGSLYLTGPYHGAPFGLSIVVPTIAGPFNLGNVVVRAQIEVDPQTAALTVTSDPLPQILDGIPLRLRTANVTVDRPGFIFNPTNCAQQHIEGTLTGAQGAVAHVSAPFAVSGCKGLAFGPKFSVYTSGHTSRADGASLDVKLEYPKGPQSNISHVKVELPKQLPARLTTLQKACPAQTFDSNPAACPTASLVGLAKAITPVLPSVLVGPAYFVSHGGEAFPNLIIVLEGYGVRIDLIGDTFISKAGITSSTFTNVPDVQVSSFELYLPEGPHSALAANGNLCKQKLKLPSLFIAQDGAQLKESTPVHVTGCHTATASRKAHKARGARSLKAGTEGQAGGEREGKVMRAHRSILIVSASLVTLAVGLAYASTPALAVKTRLPLPFSPFGYMGEQGQGGIAVDQSNGNVYAVVKELAGEVRVFGPEGGSPVGGAPSSLTGSNTPRGEFGLFGNGSSPAVDSACYLQKLGEPRCSEVDPSDGDIYVPAAGVVDKFKVNALKEYEYLCQFIGYTAAGGSECFKDTSGGFESTSAAAVDRDGNVYIVGTAGEQQAIYEFNPVGEPVAVITSSLLPGPSDVTVDSTGDIYAATSQSIVELKRSSFTGPVESEVSVASGNHIAGIAFDQATGRLLAVEAVGNTAGSIVEYGLEGKVELEFPLPGSPSGIAIDEANNDAYIMDFIDGGSGNGEDVIEAFGPPVSSVDITTEGCSGIEVEGLTVGGLANPEGNVALVRFEYGPDTLSRAEEEQEEVEITRGHHPPFASSVDATPAEVSGEAGVPVQAGLHGLEPNLTYRYRLVGTDSESSFYGTTQKCTTLAIKPVVGVQPALSVGPREAVLVGSVDPENSDTHYHFLLGTTAAYGSSVPAGEVDLGSSFGSRQVVKSIEGLQPGTTYHYALVASDSQGVAQSADQTFTTPGVLLPVVVTGGASEISQNGATISGTVDPQGVPTSYEFDLGTDTSYGSRIFGEGGSGTQPGTVALGVQGLAAGTVYHYRLVATNAYGTAYGADATFTTPGFPTTSIAGPAGAPLVPAPLFTSPSAGGPRPTTNAHKGKAKRKRNTSKKRSKKRGRRGRKAGVGGHSSQSKRRSGR